MARSSYWCRLLLYYTAIALFFQIAVVLIKKRGWEQVITEGNFIEQTQVGLAGAAFILALGIAFFDKTRRGVQILCAILLAAAFVREFNNHPAYRLYLPHSWMKAAFGLAIFLPAIWMNRAGLVHGLKQLLQREAGILYISGFCLIVLWAQVIAQSELWDYRYDRLLEESLEMAGYFFLFFATMEEIFFSFRQNRFQNIESVEIERETIAA